VLQANEITAFHKHLLLLKLLTLHFNTPGLNIHNNWIKFVHFTINLYFKCLDFIIFLHADMHHRWIKFLHLRNLYSKKSKLGQNMLSENQVLVPSSSLGHWTETLHLFRACNCLHFLYAQATTVSFELCTKSKYLLWWLSFSDMVINIYTPRYQ